MNTAQLIRHMRDILDIPEVATPWTEAELLRYLNRELLQRYAQMIVTDASWFLMQSDSTSLGMTSRQVGDEQRWLVSFPEWVHTIVRIWNRESSIYEASMTFTSPRKIQARTGEVVPYFGDAENRWMFSGRDTITVFSNPAGQTFRVWFTKSPPALIRFAATGGSSDGDTITVDMSAAPALGEWIPLAGYYVGGYVEVTSAGNAPPQGQRAAILSVAGAFPTFTFTLDRAFGTAVQAGDIIDMHPVMRESDQELIVYGGAIRALDRKGAMMHRQVLADTYASLYNSWMASITKRQTLQPPKQVTPVGGRNS